MNQMFPVFTTENACQDCCKCIRYCPCKAIRVVNGHAAIMPELCVSCGRCVRVCPAGAKKIRPDLSRGKFLVTQPEKVYVSLAPSWRGYFREVRPEQMIAALKRLGFAGVSETALGAQLVSADTSRYLKESPNGVYISSACPAAVEYIRKYAPSYTDRIVPVVSPVLAHTKLLRETFGDDIRIVFFGPCAAKKLEADSHADWLDLALTFEDLADWLKQERIEWAQLDCDGAEFVPEPAAEGRVYAVEGGMNDTLRDGTNQVRQLSLSGLDQLDRVLRCDPEGAKIADGKYFIECLSCSGGCVNGPVMPKEDTSLSGLLAAAGVYDGGNSCSREVRQQLREKPEPAAVHPAQPTELEIQTALQLVGKFSREDELNCGGCGYFTCREFAKAMLAGQAETSMCQSYMRQLAQKKSNALIRYIPAGVVIVDSNLKIIECNRHFAELCDESTVLAYEAMPGLPDLEFSRVADFGDLLQQTLETGEEIQRNNYVAGGRILNISVFSIAPRQIVGAIVQDVTQNELRREQVSERAREVIRQNVLTVQKIAGLLGEHMAETEVLLREVAGSYSSAEHDGEQHGPEL